MDSTDSLFQFLDGTIKRRKEVEALLQKENFNSLMVQLKVTGAQPIAFAKLISIP